MTNSTSTDVTFGGAWCNRVVAKQEDSHSAAPADKQINGTPNHPRIPYHCLSLNTADTIVGRLEKKY